MIIFDFKSRLEKITPAWLLDQVIDWVHNNERLLIELNQKQLQKGKDIFDKDLPTYSPFTIEQKRRKGFDFRGHERYQLFQEGDLYADMFVDAQNNEILFFSSDGKTNEVLGKLKGDPFGLNPENFAIMGTFISDYVKEKFRETLGL